MSRVFIPQLPSIKGRPADVTDANRFGAMVVVFGSDMADDVYPDTVDERMPEFLGQASKVFKTFNPDQDYLALTGSPFFIALCMWVLAADYPYLRMLRYDRLNHMYYSITLTDPIEENVTNDQGEVQHIQV